MDTAWMKSLVFDWLSGTDAKIAKKFQKEVGATALTPDSPKLKDIVAQFSNSPAGKRKAEPVTNGSSSKKAKKDESSSDDSDSEDEAPKKAEAPKKPEAKKAAPAKMEVDEESSDDSSDEDEKPAAKPAPAKATPAKAAAKKEESSDDSSDEEEAAKPAAKAAPAKAAPAKAAAKESSSDDSSDDEEMPAAKPAAKAAPAKAAAKKEESSSDDSSDEEEAKPAAKAAPAKAAPAKAAAKKEESSSDSDSDDEEEKKPAAKPAAPAKAAAKKDESSSDSDSDDEEEAKPAAKAAPAKAAKKDESSSEDSSSEEEEVAKPAKKAAAPAEDGGMVIKSNKGKTVDDFKTPTKADQSFGENPRDKSEEGRKIFIHNVGEEMQYETFQEAVEKHGTVEDFFNPGRGFAFLTFSTSEEAHACIKAMDNTEVGGNLMQMNIARPKGEKPAPGTGGKRQEAAQGCKLFVHGITQETNNADLQAAFEEYGTVTDAYNPGKGFAFVTFSKAAEATAAMEALEGQEVCGNQVNVSVAKPKAGAGDTPRGGGRGGGRGGAGGGGGRREEVAGSKLFVHNVDENTSQDDLFAAFGEHGSVTDAYNPGRGFAFITYATAAEANTAMEALEGQEVCGRQIQCNVAKPRGEAGGDAGGRGGRGGRGGGGRGGGDRGRGAPRGGRGRGGMSISAGGGGGQNKKMSFD